MGEGKVGAFADLCNDDKHVQEQDCACGFYLSGVITAVWYGSHKEPYVFKSKQLLAHSPT